VELSTIPHTSRGLIRHDRVTKFYAFILDNTPLQLRKEEISLKYLRNKKKEKKFF
jgi:hypothetical protein